MRDQYELAEEYLDKFEQLTHIDKRGVKKIDIIGQTYEVRFNAQLVIALDEWVQKHYGKDVKITDLITSESFLHGNMPPKLIIGMLMIGLSHVQRELRLTEAKILEWMDHDDFDMETVSQSVYVAYMSGRPGGKRFVENLKLMNEELRKQKAGEPVESDNQSQLEPIEDTEKKSRKKEQ